MNAGCDNSSIGHGAGKWLPLFSVTQFIVPMQTEAGKVWTDKAYRESMVALPAGVMEIKVCVVKVQASRRLN
ncbi:MAG: hypothetical protein VB877_08400 [Pirellulaceae bacterium]